ncbi:pseudouridine synthase [Longibacter salinarum]|uniref:Pseudouridine synthase n=1 Tax=Longibacter salinarum TaxID=1850348 RepID=A0A2A8D167_9BACT|nr:RluA family pseudouridine synthase [Longibacter salinarum]PEN14634.1 pseudouridine synthase [Longibacter salinarum]
MSDTFDSADYDADVERAGQSVEVTVAEDEGGARLDKYLTQFYPEASRTKVQRSIKKGHVKVNGDDASKSYRVEAGDKIVFRLIRKPPMEATPEDIPLDIVYEDDDLLVVNKPAGMVVHPAPGHRSGTLVNALLHHVGGDSVAADDEEADEAEVGLSMINALPERPDHPVVRPGIVHRLDKGTSGLLVVAKHDRAHRKLAAQFKDHSTDRRYRAIVWGQFDPRSGTITGAIGRDPHHRQRMAVVAEERGKSAVTHYRTVEEQQYTSVVEFELETGRTHQIRVHADSQNHPVLGDPKYGGQAVRYGRQGGKRRTFYERLFEHMPRPALHAYQLGFKHPTSGEEMHFEEDMPEDMQFVLDRLRAVEGAE